VVIAKVRRWQWALIGLAVGYAYGEVRRLAGPVDLAGLGPSFNDQRTFERALAARTDGLPHFTALTVYPATADRHVVAGRFYNATPRKVEKGNETLWVTGWEDRCFVAPVPYRPLAGDGAGRELPGGVREYLKTIPGVTWRYAWWADERWARVAYPAAGLAAVGGVWPTVVNLLAFGRLGRPREETVPKLPAAATRSRVRPEPAADVDALVAAASPEPGPGPVPTRASATSPAPRPLQGAAVEPVGAVAPPTPAHEFGAARDDFYPTERHAQRKSGPAGQAGRSGGGG
jgi:hypothetical protein